MYHSLQYLNYIYSQKNKSLYIMKKLMLLSHLFFLISFYGQSTNNEKLKIFYDCNTWGCEETYIKQNLPEVEFVRDRNYADVHILIVSEENGSGGQKYYLEFSGQNDFKDIQEKLDFSTGSDTTREQKREQLLKYLQLGLMKFWLKKGLADKISFKIESENNDKKEEKDQWNNWVFKLGLNGWFNGSSNNSNESYSGHASATQTKEKNKFSFSLHYSKRKNTYTYGDNEIVSDKESFNVSTNRIFGINQHWSYGIFANFNKSLYSNYDQAYQLYGGVEYSFFPYKESAKKSLVVSAQVGSLYNKYYEKTVYNQTEEVLWRSKFDLNGNIVKKWGSLYAGFEYRTYFHDFDLNSMGFNLGTNLRIAKGLSFNTHGYYGINHDQINIAAGNLSLEETLLAQKELQSDYRYYFSIGFSYSFGSIYNTIVNPRFDSSSGGSSTCICF